ncbi:MAG TPA: hypothetical protein VGM88_10680 [Kofleriaceae bacterium]
MTTCCAPRRRHAGWIAPAIGLAVIPKCPLCVVAYAAYLGIGMSFAVASALRIALIALCLGVLAWSTLAVWRRRPTARR